MRRPVNQLLPNLTVWTSLDDLERGDRNYELPSPVTNEGELLHHLVLDVPGQDQHIVRPPINDCLRCLNRDSHAREKLALLHRISIDDIVEKIDADSAIVEQGVAFGSGAVAGDRLPILPQFNQKPQEIALYAAYFVFESVKTFWLVIARVCLGSLQGCDSRQCWQRIGSGVAGVDAQRAPVSRDF